MTNRVRMLAAAVPAILAVGLAGCDTDATPAEPTPTLPTSSPPKLSDPCPKLTSAAAERYEATGPGKPTSGNATTLLGQSIGCSWGEGRDSVNISLVVSLDAGPPSPEETAARKFRDSFARHVADGSALYWQPDEGFRDESYLMVYKDSRTVELRALSGNAAVSVYLELSEIDRKDWKGTLDRQRSALRELADDVFDDLA